MPILLATINILLKNCKIQVLRIVNGLKISTHKNNKQSKIVEWPLWYKYKENLFSNISVKVFVNVQF